VEATLRGSGISKLFVVVIGVIVAVSLGAMAIYVSTKVGGPAAAQGHVSQGQLSSGPAYHQIDNRGVIQTTNNFPGPDAQERNGRLAADSGATPTLSDLGLDFRG
jgi:hypothetical protein